VTGVAGEAGLHHNGGAHITGIRARREGGKRRRGMIERREKNTSRIKTVTVWNQSGGRHTAIFTERTRQMKGPHTKKTLMGEVKKKVPNYRHENPWRDDNGGLFKEPTRVEKPGYKGGQGTVEMEGRF